jgi:hypothetical protein
VIILAGLGDLHRRARNRRVSEAMRRRLRNAFSESVMRGWRRQAMLRVGKERLALKRRTRTYALCVACWATDTADRKKVHRFNELRKVLYLIRKK